MAVSALKTTGATTPAVPKAKSAAPAPGAYSFLNPAPTSTQVAVMPLGTSQMDPLGNTLYTPGVTAPGVPSGGGGGGGSAAPAPMPQMSFDDYVQNDFGYTTARNEGDRRLQEFDAQTLLQRQQAEGEQGRRRAILQQVLQEMGNSTANDFANRGLLRSGLYMQGQDKVDQAGVRGNQDIDQILTDLITQRQQGKVSLEQQNRATLNDVLNQLSQQFNSGLQIPQG